MTMQNVNMFEVATRNQFRFAFKGMLNVEDLWQLSPRDLDAIFKSLNSELKKVKEESLLEIKSAEDQILDVKINIVKHIFNVKQEEENQRLKAKENKEKKQKLMEILANKEDQDLLDKSAEDIQKMIDELN